jgi:putative inorganic carbon (HCO3(-)) transporter
MWTLCGALCSKWCTAEPGRPEPRCGASCGSGACSTAPPARGRPDELGISFSNLGEGHAVEPSSQVTRHGRDAPSRAAGAAPPPCPNRAPTTVARLLGAYIVLAIGRVSELVPWLNQIPLVKMVFVLLIISAMRHREDLASVTWKSIPPAKLTVLLMGIITVSIVFSVLRSATFALITNFLPLVAITLLLTIKASRGWTLVKTMLHGNVFAACILTIAAFSTSAAGRAGNSSNYDPNDFAFVMVGLLPLMATFGIISRGAKRLLYFGLAASLALAILLTQSRGGFLGLIFDIIAMTFLLPFASRGQLQFRISKSQVIARAVLLALIGVVGWQSLPGTARDRLATITALGSDYNLNIAEGGRLAIWARNLPYVLHRPWGYGAGTFETVDGLFGGGRYQAPHNTYLQVLVELGVPGFALFIAVILYSLRYLYVPVDTEPENDKGAAPDEPRAFSRGLAIGLIGLCISGFFLSELYAYVFWTFVTLSCAVGIVRRMPPGARGATPSAGPAVRGRRGRATAIRVRPTAKRTTSFGHSVPDRRIPMICRSMR